MNIVDELRDTAVFAILRDRSGEQLDQVIDELVDGGIRVIEVTLPTPGSLDAIERAVSRHPDAVIGAGTVMCVEDVDRAVDAGARFILSPHIDPEVIARTGARSAGSVPGALTPTEIALAIRSGADAVKVFPARSVGAEYFSDIAAPLPEAALVAVGGVSIDQITAYVAAGAVAVGLGSPLLGDVFRGGSMHDFRQRIHRATTAVSAITPDR